MKTNFLFHFLKVTTIITLFLLCYSSTSFAEEDVSAVKKVLNTYNTAMQKLDTTGTAQLFSDSSLIVESGSIEGTYKHYEEHHIGPELAEFKSFVYSDYKSNVTIDNDFAFVTEEFKYKILIIEGDKISQRNAVTTTVLKRMNGEWKIVVMHFSSRK